MMLRRMAYLVVFAGAVLAAERGEEIRLWEKGAPGSEGVTAPEDLMKDVDVLENGPHPASECVYVVFEEVFAHNRYALRDLAVLEARS